MQKKSSDIIRSEKRKSFFLREISQMIREVAQDEASLLEIFVTRVDFSPGDGICYVYISGFKGKESYDVALETLKLYKPSIRKALASSRHARYTPDIRFVYDNTKDKSRKVDELLYEVQEELNKAPSD